MATDARQQAADLVQKLISNGDRFSFFQAIRLLRLHAQRQGQNPDDVIRTRPRLGMGFPKTDLTSVKLTQKDTYDVIANFLGLYGVDSPLPMFYTEDLLREQSDGYTVNREFLDIFAQSLYPIFYQTWLKTRPSVRVVEHNDERMLAILYAFVGIDSPNENTMAPGVGALLRAGANFSRLTRTAAGLQSVIQVCFPQAQVSVEQLHPVKVLIPQQQRCYLGEQAAGLGDDAHLGHECRSLSGIKLRLLELPASLFLSLLRDGQQHERIRFLVDYYLIEPVALRVELGLAAGQAAPVQLGSPVWSKLGANTWLLPSGHERPTHVTFDVAARRHSPLWS